MGRFTGSSVVAHGFASVCRASYNASASRSVYAWHGTVRAIATIDTDVPKGQPGGVGGE